MTATVPAAQAGASAAATGSADADAGADADADAALTLRDLLDAVFLVALMAAALGGLRTTFTGTGWIVAAAAGTAVALAVSTLVTGRRWPVWTMVPLLVLGYYLFGGVVLLRDEAVAHVLPDLAVLRDLSGVLVDGWKRLLTTLPPLASSGRLLALPYVIALVGTAIGAGAAQRSRARFGPSVGPALAFASATLLGTTQAPDRLWQGITFGCVVAWWAALRRPHARALSVRRTPGRLQRVVIGVLVLALAGAGAGWLGQRLPGHGSHRTVLRDHVTPPFDVSTLASPLAGFRQFTKNADLLYDQELFTVQGLPSGVPVRLAALDDYDGLVWGATDGTKPTGPGQPIDAFQRVGARITTTTTKSAPTSRIGVTIGPGYAATPDLDAWLPTAGVLHSIVFAGARTADLEDGLRYNLSTASGIVTDRLAAGDSYTLTAGELEPQAATLPAGAEPAGPPTLGGAADSFVAGRATQWAADARSVLGQVAAVAARLRAGAYSDGGPGQTQYLPGDSVSRLTSFLDSAQLVGDDEQYAAAFALICNYLGLPARVVLLAEPENGVVRGRDVHTGVEVDLRTGATRGWLLLDRSYFMPDPGVGPGASAGDAQDAQAAVVPPPTPARPPTLPVQSTGPDPVPHPHPDRNAQHGLLAGWRGAVVLYGAIVLALLILLALVVALVKWQRRSWRRRHGPAADRFDAGWREFLDWAHDLGVVVPSGRTRGEQAQTLAANPAGDRARRLAAAADAGVFGPDRPSAEAAADFWRQVDEARRAVARSAGRLGALRATVNPRSLRRPTRAVRPV